MRDTLSHACMCKHGTVECVDVFCVHPPSVTVDLIDCDRNPTATRENVLKKVNYELYMACENSDKIRVTPFMVALLSFNVVNNCAHPLVVLVLCVFCTFQHFPVSFAATAATV